jgi:hypothetical protein
MELLNAKRFFLQGLNMRTQILQVINTGEENFPVLGIPDYHFSGTIDFSGTGTIRDLSLPQPREYRTGPGAQVKVSRLFPDFFVLIPV